MVAALIIIVILLLAVFVVFVVPAVPALHLTNVTQPGCPNPGSALYVSAPTPNYDVQQVMIFTQTYSSLAFNVTAIAQCDVNGYGPSYLLNGLTNTGYWYQVGINWNWPLQHGGYTPGFGFVSEEWAPGGVTRSPQSTAFSGTVNQGDTIEMNLSFSDGQVIASAVDLNTSADGSMSYPAGSATAFLGSQAQESQSRFSFATQGYFTGLMTEWYHVNANGNGPGEKVVYSESITPITSATLSVGEWNFTTSNPGTVFSDAVDNGNPIDLSSQPNQLQTFTLDGYALSVDGYQFVTGS